MRILITNYQMTGFTGTEVYTYTLAVMLKRNGHDVVVYTKYPGEMTQKLADMNIPWTHNLHMIEDMHFDIGHIHHNICAYEVRLVFPTLPLIFLSHGIKNLLEQPPLIDIHISQFLAISEGVKHHLESTYGIQNVIIARNTFDTLLFREKTVVHDQPRRALIISNHLVGDKRRVIINALNQLKIDYVQIGGSNNISNELLPEKINSADIVFTLGRGVVESLLCGRIAFVYDMATADGIVTPENYDFLRETHFSGLTYNRWFTTEDVIHEIKEHYSKTNTDVLEQYALRDYSAEKIYHVLLPL